MRRDRWHWIVVLAALIALLGCGGGSSSDKDATIGGDTSADSNTADTSADSTPAGDIDGSEDLLTGIDSSADLSGGEDAIKDTAQGADGEDTTTDTTPAPDPATVCQIHQQCPAPILYHKKVSPPAECYCAKCESPKISLNKTTHDAYQTIWEGSCKDWSTENCKEPQECQKTRARACLRGACRLALASAACKSELHCPQSVLYFKPVYSVSDCYCPTCDVSTVQINQPTHELYQQMWQTHCTQWSANNPCPDVDCAKPIGRECRSNVCAPKNLVQKVDSCATADDCPLNIPINVPILSTGNCKCLACNFNPTPINKETLEYYTQLHASMCADWVPHASCPSIASCIAPALKPVCDNGTCKFIGK